MTNVYSGFTPYVKTCRMTRIPLSYKQPDILVGLHKIWHCFSSSFIPLACKLFRYPVQDPELESLDSGSETERRNPSGSPQTAKKQAPGLRHTKS